jgi:drug/metabolite transporter (DMT)-like permease
MTATVGTSRPRLGIPLALLAVLCFTLLDGTAKAMADGHHMAMLVWARYAFGLGWLLLLMPKGRGLGVLATDRPLVHVARGLLVMASTGFMFAAVRHLPLATIYAIAFLSPLIVAILSVPVLGERVRPAQWLAILGGFAGVLVVVRPGMVALDWTILLPFAMAATYAGYQILTRVTGLEDPPLTALLYMTLVGFATSTLSLPVAWTTPEPWDWAVFAAMGAFGTMGHLCLIKALTVAPASVVSPFTYSQIVWATLVGALWFGQPPDAPTLAGAAIVIASGIWLMRAGGR